MQDGIIGWTRKDIVALAKFPVSRMKEIHYLIMEQHWDLERCFRFVDQKPDIKTKIQGLISRCLFTPEFHYTCAVRGYDISIKACPALASRIKELRQKPSVKTSVKPREWSITEWY